jgi:hypothetical protein
MPGMPGSEYLDRGIRAKTVPLELQGVAFTIAAIANRYDSMRKMVFQMVFDRFPGLLKGSGKLPFPGASILGSRQAQMDMAVAKPWQKSAGGKIDIRPGQFRRTAVSMDRQDIPAGDLHDTVAQRRASFAVYQPSGSQSPDRFFISFSARVFQD